MGEGHHGSLGGPARREETSLGSTGCHRRIRSHWRKGRRTKTKPRRRPSGRRGYRRCRPQKRNPRRMRSSPLPMDSLMPERRSGVALLTSSAFPRGGQTRIPLKRDCCFYRESLSHPKKKNTLWLAGGRGENKDPLARRNYPNDLRRERRSVEAKTKKNVEIN